jgi:ribonucleoside-diphosphate reductase alpha chain
LLERVKHFNREWVKVGHNNGQNTHNISATVSIKPEEWEMVGEWMWENRKFYNGLSVLPYNGGTYTQAPFEDCTADVYEDMMSSLHNIDLNNVHEITDNTDLSGEIACGADGCVIV